MKSKSITILSSFLEKAKDFLRVPEGHPELLYYGTGESAHWAVQSSMNICAAYAVSGADLGNREHLEIALKLFRYAMRTHVTGDITATDGLQWGRHWISVLGAERMTHGINALEKYMTDDDLARYKLFRVCESDYRLTDYPVVAGMTAASKKNKPESNMWNGGFLWRTALDYPEELHAQAWKEKGTALLLNAISHPADAASEKEYAGKPLREWHAGFNFTPNYSLDHHGYMNVGYSIITLSNLAMLYFNFRERGQQIPEELFLHAEDLWKVVRRFFFSDGRLLRIGGDSRSRYTYCQTFVIPVLLFAADHLHDPEALPLEKNYIDLIEKEQKFNGDGSFYGRRLNDIRNESYYYYVRLESDPADTLSMDIHYRKKNLIPALPEKTPETKACWHDEFHGAALLADEKAVRSFVRRSEKGPLALCVPPDRSNMAEWYENSFTRAELRHSGHKQIRHTEIFEKDLFLASGTFLRVEEKPCGEGEQIYPVAKDDYCVCALPDGCTNVIFERFSVIKETCFRSVETLNIEIPNDVYNNCRRSYEGKEFSMETASLPPKDEIIETNSKVLTVDGVLSVAALYGIRSLKIHREPRRTASVIGTKEMSSLYIERICGEVTPSFRHALPGEVLSDSIAAVRIHASEDFASDAVCSAEGDLRIAEITGADSVHYRIVTNFGKKALSYDGIEVGPGKAFIKEL